VGVDVWVWLPTVSAAAIGAGVAATAMASLIATVVRRRGWVWVQAEIRLCRRPWVATVTGIAVALTMHQFPTIAVGLRRAAWIPVIVTACWLVIHSARVGECIVFHRLPLEVEHNHRVRRVRSQVAMLRRLIAVAAIAFGIAGAALLLLPGLPAVGASLFASAGLAGIVAGLAAQSTLANVFAGMQLAFTDAVRVDDAVVVEGEWGWIEEITLTYVVLHIWDERRLVLPTSYFTTMPFQNWTRHQCQLLGSVILHLDYATPVTALRAHAQRVIEASPLWDRKDWVLQVTSTTETTMVVRVLASAKDGPTSWDLRCEIREALLVYLQERHPQALPVHRWLSAPGRDGDVHACGANLPRTAPEQLDLTSIDLDDLTRSEAEPSVFAGEISGQDRVPVHAQLPGQARRPRRAHLRRAEVRRAERSAGVPPSTKPRQDNTFGESQ
jgi:small-conductance mechanosensitive channel